MNDTNSSIRSLTAPEVRRIELALQHMIGNLIDMAVDTDRDLDYLMSIDVGEPSHCGFDLSPLAQPLIDDIKRYTKVLAKVQTGWIGPSDYGMRGETEREHQPSPVPAPAPAPTPVPIVPPVPNKPKRGRPSKRTVK